MSIFNGASNALAQRRSSATRVESEVAEHPEKEPTLLEVLRSDGVKRLSFNFQRLLVILCAVVSPATGILRWLRGGVRRGVLAGVLWCIFCWCGFFPPPLWAWPIYIWAACLINCMFMAAQREVDWGTVSEACMVRELETHVWNEDAAEAAGPASTLNERISWWKKLILDINSELEIILSFAEKISNAFDFSDGAASTLFFAALGVLAFGLSACAFVWVHLDPNGDFLSKISGFIGAAVCIALSREEPSDGAPVPPPLLPELNKVFECIPDQDEMAHRYIATNVQCKADPPTKTVQSPPTKPVQSPGLKPSPNSGGHDATPEYMLSSLS